MSPPRAVPTTEVLGIPLYAGNLTSAVDHALELCAGPRSNALISLTGAHGLVLAREDADFAERLKRFDVNLPDGKPGTWVGRLRGAAQMRQCRGADFFRLLVERSASTPYRHFFCGGKEGVADELAETCRLRFGNDHRAGTYCPPFRELVADEWSALAGQIIETDARIVWIGLSTPKQEAFAERLSLELQQLGGGVHIIACVGAAFDFHTGHMTEAPRVMRDVGLEWLFRLGCEPRRLARRYAHVVPRFLAYATRDLLRGG